MGAPSWGGEGPRRAGSGGRTSIGTDLEGTSLIFGGWSTLLSVNPFNDILFHRAEGADFGHAIPRVGRMWRTAERFIAAKTRPPNARASASDVAAPKA